MQRVHVAPELASPFLEGIEEALVQNAFQADAVEAAGPHFLKRYGADRSHLMHEIEGSLVYPLKFWERDRIDVAAGMDAEQLRRHFPEAGALSFWTGTWIGQDLPLALNTQGGRRPGRNPGEQDIDCCFCRYGT